MLKKDSVVFLFLSCLRQIILNLKMDFYIFLTFIVTLISISCYLVRRRYCFWSDRGFLQAKPSFPFGNIKGIGFKKHKSTIMTDLYNEHKNKAPVLGIYFFTSPTILAMDLDIIKHFLVKDFGTFHDRGFYSNAKVDPLSANLFTLVGQEWRDFRAKLTPSFTSGKIKMMFETVVEVSKNMIDTLKSEQSRDVEMKGILADFTTDVIGKVAFGLDINSIKDPTNMFRTMGARVFITRPLRIIKIFFMISFKNLATKLNLRFHDKDVSDFFISSIEQTLNYRKENNIVRPDFINLLMQIKDKNGESLSRDEMAAHSFLWYLAGFETSSTTMTFCLYELALNVDVQEKLRSEIKDVLKKHNDVLTYEAMQEMKYLQMVIDGKLKFKLKYLILNLIAK